MRDRDNEKLLSGIKGKLEDIQRLILQPNKINLRFKCKFDKKIDTRQIFFSYKKLFTFQKQTEQKR